MSGAVCRSQWVGGLWDSLLVAWLREGGGACQLTAYSIAVVHAI